ncbi:hypothetical protein [Parasitella parasitica]|uniref:Uncharacterized protein n=1 Tax=Parasitella parasitica TaxID=35722 RepID=A0A0B7N8A0_9FUNG|nr:hypothetical protein [Parasitella parasitica]
MKRIPAVETLEGIICIYARKHISGESKQRFTERVKGDPYITPKKMTTGISSNTSRITEAARKIDPILSNQDRVKYELNVARSALGIHKSSNFLGEFQNIQREYEGYITYAEVAPKENFIIAFYSIASRFSSSSFFHATYYHRCDL